MEMRIVVMTNAGTQGQQVLEALARRGVRPHAVVVVTIYQSQLVERLRSVARFFVRQRKMCRRFTSRVVCSGEMNSERLLRDLRRLEPGLLVLGGGGILGQEVIDTASVGVLNAHPALLPWMRGNVLAGMDLQRGVALGGTVHFVDRGIDTGPIIERRLLPVDGPTTHKELRPHLRAMTNDILADVVARAIETGEAPQAVRQSERFPLLRRPKDHDDLRALGAVACSDQPRALFEAWSPLCLPGPRWKLPNMPVEPPQPLLNWEPIAKP